MASMAPQMLGQLGQLPQMFGQMPQMLGQFPQMLGQFPQMAMGMLGPLTSGMNAGSLTGAAGLEKAAGGLDQATLAATTDAAAAAEVAAARRLGGATGVMSSFTRPTGSFNAPGPPKLPTGWAPGAASGAGSGDVRAARRRQVAEAACTAHPPPHAARDERGKEGSAEGRTMQLTVGPRTGRED